MTARLDLKSIRFTYAFRKKLSPPNKAQKPSKTLYKTQNSPDLKFEI